jgi:hypothetical protein
VSRRGNPASKSRQAWVQMDSDRVQITGLRQRSLGAALRSCLGPRAECVSDVREISNHERGFSTGGQSEARQKQRFECIMHVPANVLCDAADTEGEALSMSRDAGAAPQAGEPASWSIRGAQPSAEEASFPHAGLGGGDGEGGGGC